MQKEKKLTPRQHALRRYIEEHFESGKYITIEEICAANIGYTLNTDPKIHDKCVELSRDVKEINFCTTEHRKIIVKDKYGSIKLAESQEEVDKFLAPIYKAAIKKFQYCAAIGNKALKNGTIPFINQAGRVLEPEEMKPVEVFKQ